MKPFCRSSAGETFHGLARVRASDGKRKRRQNAVGHSHFESSFSRSPTRSPRPTRAGRRLLSQAYLDEVRHGALILLYRLLFVLYAEDRNLLPDETGPYAVTV